MKVLIGVILIGLGIILGIWLGVFVLFIPGILQFFQSLYPINLTGVAWGIIKVFLSGITGWGVFLICTLIGGYLIYNN